MLQPSEAEAPSDFEGLQDSLKNFQLPIELLLNDTPHSTIETPTSNNDASKINVGPQTPDSGYNSSSTTTPVRFFQSRLRLISPENIAQSMQKHLDDKGTRPLSHSPIHQ